jgi:acyl-coenzyme A thioesterase PaaI-like protein
MTKLANSKYCFVCGLENQDGLKLILESPQAGRVTGRINIPGKFQGWPGIVHGGIIAAILDEAAGRTATETIPNQVYLTGTMNVRYRHPVKCETPLLVEAEMIHRKGRVVTSRSKLLDESRLVLAEAEIVYVQLEQDPGFGHTERQDEWLVEDDEERPNDQ